MSSIYDIGIRQNWYCHNKKHNSFTKTNFFHLTYYFSYKVPKQQMTKFWTSKCSWN
jgi:hypothetical protein